MVMLPPSTTVSSWMMTASAPSGITPPVKIRTASPAPTVRSNGRPAATSPITLSRAADLRRIGRAHRIAVHRRHRLRRLGAQRRDVARQHAVMRRIERDHFLGQRLGARENRGKRVGNRHQCHGETPKSPSKLRVSRMSEARASSASRHVIRRCHVNGRSGPRPRAFDILGEIVEEHDAPRRHADRLHHMIIGRRVGFSKPDRRGQEYFAEMAEHVGIGLREMLDMGGLVLENA